MTKRGSGTQFGMISRIVSVEVKCTTPIKLYSAASTHLTHLRAEFGPLASGRADIKSRPSCRERPGAAVKPRPLDVFSLRA